MRFRDNDWRTFEVFYSDGHRELFDAEYAEDFLKDLLTLPPDELENIYMIKERIKQRESFSSSGATQSSNICNGSKIDSIDMFPSIKKKKKRKSTEEEDLLF